MAVVVVPERQGQDRLLPLAALAPVVKDLVVGMEQILVVVVAVVVLLVVVYLLLPPKQQGLVE